MNGINGFVFGNFNSAEYGIIMTEPPPFVIAERDVEKMSVAGRSGDLIIDNGRYKNVIIPYKCAIIPEGDQSLRDAAIAAVGLLKQTANYVRLENTYNPDYYRLARIYGQISVDSIVEQAGIFTVSFDLKPQRFLKIGEQPLEITEHTVLHNPTLFTALPLIRVFGVGVGSVTVGDTTVIIKSMVDDIVLDSALMDAYHVAANNSLESRNGSIYAPVYPKLLAGNNAISWAGGVSKIEIIPRWWTL